MPILFTQAWPHTDSTYSHRNSHSFNQINTIGYGSLIG